VTGERIIRVGELLVLGVDGGKDTGVALVRAHPRPGGAPLELLAQSTLRGRGDGTRADELRLWLEENVPAWGVMRPDQLGLCGTVEGVAFYGGSPERTRGLTAASWMTGYYRGALDQLIIPTIELDAARVRGNLGVKSNATKAALWATTKLWVGLGVLGANEHERDAVAIACASWNLWEKVLESRP
jgi:hypothetical protein